MFTHKDKDKDKDKVEKYYELDASKLRVMHSGSLDPDEKNAEQDTLYVDLKGTTLYIYLIEDKRVGSYISISKELSAEILKKLPPTFTSSQDRILINMLLEEINKSPISLETKIFRYIKYIEEFKYNDLRKLIRQPIVKFEARNYAIESELFSELKALQAANLDLSQEKYLLKVEWQFHFSLGAYDNCQAILNQLFFKVPAYEAQGNVLNVLIELHSMQALLALVNNQFTEADKQLGLVSKHSQNLQKNQAEKIDRSSDAFPKFMEDVDRSNKEFLNIMEIVEERKKEFNSKTVEESKEFNLTDSLYSFFNDAEKAIDELVSSLKTEYS